MRLLVADAVKKADTEKIKAAHRIMEGFDVVVSTCIGAADKSILAAMGRSETWKPGFPLSFPFVVVDEACQSLEAATLVPIVNANPKSLVLLGDPMQLPPTVLSSDAVLEKR